MSAPRKRGAKCSEKCLTCGTPGATSEVQIAREGARPLTAFLHRGEVITVSVGGKVILRVEVP